MDIITLNQQLLEGNIEQSGLFPHIENLKTSPYIFNINFGLGMLPTDPGILIIRGPRQYGKSTWMEQQIYNSIQEFGKGCAFYLNGDNIPDQHELEKAIETLLAAFPNDAPLRRIFIDEITAITHWELCLKRLADKGRLKNILVITTGSKATDLRRGAEKLPGRKGRLARTTYLFTPIPFAEFNRVCGSALGEDTLTAYLLSGGSPLACAELGARRVLPEFVIELTRDWIEGEIAASGRSRAALLNIMSVLFRWGGTPVGQAKLAREAGLANNTVAAGYIELLTDLTCVIPTYPWDPSLHIKILRKPCKYHFTNLLAAIAYHPARIRHINDFAQLNTQEQGILYEWLIAQELERRIANAGEEILEPLAFWQNQEHEIDFVASPKHLIEVKRGACSALEFAWCLKIFGKSHLTVINKNTFQAGNVQGLTLKDFLQGTE